MPDLAIEIVRALEAIGAAEDVGGPAPRTPEDSGPIDPSGPYWELLEQTAILPLNDYGNGQRLIAHFGSDMLYVPRYGWHLWDGRIWRFDENALGVRKLAHRVQKIIDDETATLMLDPEEEAEIAAAAQAREEYEALAVKHHAKLTEDEYRRRRLLSAQMDRAQVLREKKAKRRARHLTHAKSAGNAGPVKNMLESAEPYIARAISDLNTDPLAFAVENGVIRLLTPEIDPHEAEWVADPRPRARAILEAHDRAQMITKIMPVEYDPEAACPRFELFLAEIQPDPAMRAFLQRWFGYSLTGLTSEQKLVFLHGGGRNGKSTLVDLIAKILGDYATSIPIESLTGTEQRKGADATPDLVRVPGARMIRASEPEEGLAFREALIKLLTGGEPILIRRMREEFVEVEPEFKLTISGNHKPKVKGNDDGIWRRILLVPFDVQVAKEDVDPLLPQILWAERAGVLNWLIAGARAFLEGGLAEPDAVREATEEFRDESDALRVFIRDCCEVTGDPGHFTRSKALIEAFAFYLQERGETPWGPRTVSTRLAGMAGKYKDPASGQMFAAHKIGDTGYRGIRIRQDFEDRRQAAAWDAEGYRP